MNQLLRFLNIKVDFDKNKHVLTIDAADPVLSEAPLEYVSRMRASMVVLGPLLARQVMRKLRFLVDVRLVRGQLIYILRDYVN